MARTKSPKRRTYINQPQDLKTRMLAYMEKYPRNVNWYADQIGISWVTLNAFLYEGRWANMGTLTKITNFLNAQEQ